MKKNKISAFALAALTVSSLWLGSCKDDFSEEDLINAQQERADEQSAENIAVINASNVTYRVNLHSNQEPQVGVSVSITDQSTGELSSTTTDASGNAIFTDINLGAKLVQVVSENHADMSWVVDFGEPTEGRHYQILNGNAFALEVAEFSKVEMVQTTGMQTATVTGLVSIETDLTNRSSEVPQDLVLRANLDGFVNASHSNPGNSSFSSIYVEGSLTFTEGNIASATVNNETGEYTLQVPATEDGSFVEIILPLVEADQTLAHSFLNGVEVGPQVSTVPARFGPGVEAKETPNVDGTIAVFPEPAAPGRGVAFDFVAPPTGIFGTSAANNIFLLENGLTSFSSGIINGSMGEGYQSTPSLTVSEPNLTEEQGGVQAELTPVMRWELPSFNITAGGDGYAVNSSFDYEIRAFNSDDEQITFFSDEGFGTFTTVVGSFENPVTSDDTGSLNAETYEVQISQVGFDNNIVYTNQPVARFEVAVPGTAGTQPTITLTYNGMVEFIRVDNEGDGYTDNPSITFEGGSPTTPANFELRASKQWIIEVDNTSVTQSYLIPPDQGETANFVAEIVNELDGSTFNSNLAAAEVDENGFITAIDATFLDELLTENGNVVLPQGPLSHWATVFLSFEKPRLLFVEPEHERATADVTVNDDGEITFINIVNGGLGYPAPFGLEIVSLSGTGSGVDFVLDIDGDENTGYFADGLVLINGGSGYLGPDINIEQSNSTQDLSFVLKNGQTAIQNIDYGTGATLDDVLPPN